PAPFVAHGHRRAAHEECTDDRDDERGALPGQKRREAVQPARKARAFGHRELERDERRDEERQPKCRERANGPGVHARPATAARRAIAAVRAGIRVTSRRLGTAVGGGWRGWRRQ